MQNNASAVKIKYKSHKREMEILLAKNDITVYFIAITIHNLNYTFSFSQFINALQTIARLGKR